MQFQKTSSYLKENQMAADTGKQLRFEFEYSAEKLYYMYYQR